MAPPVAGLRGYPAEPPAARRIRSVSRSMAVSVPPALPMASLQRVKEDATTGDPSVANVAFSDVADPRFVEELIAQGYFASL